MTFRRLSRGILVGLIAVLCAPVSGAVRQVVSVLVVAPTGTQIRHSGTATLVGVGAGAEFLPGDAIRTAGESPVLLACTGSDDAARDLTFELPTNSLVVFGSRIPTEARNQQRTDTPCTLPLDDRAIQATMDDARVRANLKGTWHDRVNLLSDYGRQEIERRLQPVEAALAAKPDDLLSLLALARTLEDAGLLADSIEAYLRLYEAHKAAAWAPRSATRLLARLLPEPDITAVIPPEPEERNPDLHARRVGDQASSTDMATGPIAPRGPVYALLVGLDKYNTVGVRDLDYAEADAKLFQQFLESPRGGPEKHIKLINSANGTASAIRQALEDLVANHSSSQNTTLIIYIAAHGYYVCVDRNGVPVAAADCGDPDLAEPFILTANTSPDGPRETGLPLRTLHSLIVENAYRFGRVLAYIDVCHAHILDWNSGRTNPPPIPPDAIKANFKAQKGAMALMLASSEDKFNREKELAYESDQLGHGIFTYFVVAGLGGATAPAGDVVLFSDLYDYVRQRVSTFTGREQQPSIDSNSPRIAAVNYSIGTLYSVPPPDPTKKKMRSRSRSPRRDRLASPMPPAISSAIRESLPGADNRERFERAIEGHRLLPGEPESAFDAFQRLSSILGESDLKPLRDRLRVALEDAGQQVLILYLQGDQVPQTKADFERGRQLFAAALALSPAATANESRMLFCAGRVKIFEKKYGEAQKLLEQSIRLDPLHGYAYNAMGIALLEQIPNSPMLLEPAIQAFSDARTMEPMWAYPLHNLALAYAQRGDNARAIESYQNAMRIAPAYSYLPYNLGLLYERLNEPELAEKNFELVLKRAAARAARLGVPQDRWVEKAAPLNAIGTLYLSEGRLGAAARQFELARKADPKYVPALHNTGVVLAAHGRREEAVEKWREALTVDPNFTAARLSLAQSLLELGNFDNASVEFAEILRLHPDYLAARRSLAQTLAGLCRDGQALEELNRAVEADPGFHDLAVERDDVAALIAGRHPQTRTIRRILAERTCP